MFEYIFFFYISNVLKFIFLMYLFLISNVEKQLLRWHLGADKRLRRAHGDISGMVEYPSSPPLCDLYWWPMELHAVFDKSYAKMNFELVYFFFFGNCLLLLLWFYANKLCQGFRFFNWLSSGTSCSSSCTCTRQGRRWLFKSGWKRESRRKRKRRRRRDRGKDRRTQTKKAFIIGLLVSI